MGLMDSIPFFKSEPKFGRVPPGEIDNSEPITFPDDSPAKVKTESKDVKQEAINPDKKTVSKIETARLNEGVYKPSVQQSSSIISADYYRRGKHTDKSTKGVIAKTNTGSYKEYSSYEYNPRFLQDPEQEEVANLRLIGKRKPDSTSEDIDLIPPYSKFFLESYSEGHAERSQIVETFGDAYIFFFGERPIVYTFNGTLLNTKDINWKEDFMFYYNNFLRGTKAVGYNAKVLLTYGFNQIEGYVMGVNMGANAQNEKGVQMSFQMFVTKRRTMKLSLDFGIVEENGKFNEDSSISNLITLGISDLNVSNAYNHADKVNNAGLPPSIINNTSTKELGNIQNVLKGQDLMTTNGKVSIA